MREELFLQFVFVFFISFLFSEILFGHDLPVVRFYNFVGLLVHVHSAL